MAECKRLIVTWKAPDKAWYDKPLHGAWHKGWTTEERPHKNGAKHPACSQTPENNTTHGWVRGNFFQLIANNIIMLLLLSFLVSPFFSFSMILGFDRYQCFFTIRCHHLLLHSTDDLFDDLHWWFSPLALDQCCILTKAVATFTFSISFSCCCLSSWTVDSYYCLISSNNFFVSYSLILVDLSGIANLFLFNFKLLLFFPDVCHSFYASFLPDSQC